MKKNSVDGLNVDLYWPDGIDPSDWRNMEDVDGDAFDNDEDRKTPRDVRSISGIDPDEEGWD